MRSVLWLAAVLVGVAVVVGPATAADVVVTITPGGSPVTVTTTESGQNARLTFTGSEGQRVFTKVSSVALTPSSSYEVVDLLSPSNVRIGGTGAISSLGYIDTKALATTGTHTIKVDPGGTAVGSSTVTLYDVPPDASGMLQLDGEAVRITTTTPGQDAQLTFSGTAATRVYLNRGGTTISGSTIKVLKPDQSLLESSGLVGASDASEALDLPVSGTYKVIIDGFQAAIGTMTLSLSTNPQTVGMLADDQSESVGDDSGVDPAAPAPMSPTGSVASGSYTTEVWPAGETGLDDGVRVVSSSAPGTAALTGVVLDQTTDEPIAGASVSLASSGASATTSTDADGAYALINMPGGTYTLTITASGYGTYQVTNSSYGGDETYQLTSFLSSSAQTYNEAGVDAASATTPGDNSPDDNYSWTQVPPSLLIGRYATYPEGHDDNCDRMSEEPLDTLRWPLSYYLPRVARPEVGSLNLNHVGMKGFLAMAMNFAWFRKTKTDANEPFDVDNSTLFQCFRNYKRVPSTWRIWMFDVLNERAVRSGGLLETRYQDGTAPPLCNDPVFPSGGAIASQNTIKALSESSYACPQRTNWRDIVKYWYGVGTDVVPGAKPGLSSVGSHVENGKIKLTFRAETSGANTAWEFHLDRRVTAGSTPGPRRIATLPFRWRSRTMPNCIQARRAVPTCYTYTPPDSGCYEYRVRAWNPVGPAQWVSFTQPGKGLSTSGVCSLG